MIGIFDSSSGGLSVLRAIRKRAPNADIVYFGDIKNAPYGNKSREEIGALTVVGIQTLIREGATEIVSACNSVSVSIVLPMFEILDIPRVNLVEMVGPTISSFKGRKARILVLATCATIESGMYQEGFAMIGVTADGLAFPDLAYRIEHGADSAEMFEVIVKAIAPYASVGYTHMLLGCTHFPLIFNLFEEACTQLHISAEIVNPANAVADTVVSRFDIQGTARTNLIVSQESAVFDMFARVCVDGVYTIRVR